MMLVYHLSSPLFISMSCRMRDTGAGGRRRPLAPPPKTGVSALIMVLPSEEHGVMFPEAVTFR